MTGRRTGFSLVELFVVIGVLATLVGLLLPAVQSTRAAAARIDCQNRLKQIALAVTNYHDTHGHYPLDADYDVKDTSKWLSWMTRILPQMGRADLWTASEAAFRTEPLPYVSPPHVGYVTPVGSYVCPADARLGSPVNASSGGPVAMTSYIGGGGAYTAGGTVTTPAGLVGPNPGIFVSWTTSRVADVQDGLSQTLMAGERPPPNSYQAGQWYQTAYIRERFGGPDGVMFDIARKVLGDPCGGGGVYGPGRLDNPCDRYQFWSLHPGGANFAMADGSVRFLPYTARELIPALLTRSGGETFELP